MKIFSKFKKQMIIKNCRTTFSKTHFDASKSEKNTFFCEIFYKKCLTLSQENQKSLFKHILFGRSKSPVKGSKIFHRLDEKFDYSFFYRNFIQN
jgi:hypothetical protein